MKRWLYGMLLVAGLHEARLLISSVIRQSDGLRWNLQTQ
jgi:hypothetical protein